MLKVLFYIYTYAFPALAQQRLSSDKKVYQKKVTMQGHNLTYRDWRRVFFKKDYAVT